jgi:hypothetical protein
MFGNQEFIHSEPAPERGALEIGPKTQIVIFSKTTYAFN